MPRYYKLLEDGTVEGTDNAMEVYGRDRHIGNDMVGDVHISTVFLGMDHNYFGEGPPILFETMIFGGEYDQQMERYRTIQEAQDGHARWVERVTPVQEPAQPPLPPLKFGGKRKIRFD